MICNILLKGFLIGFSTALPVEAIGILCMRRTLAGGFFCGWVSGLGSATADAFYIAIASSGFSILKGFLEQHQTGLQLLSGLIFCVIGYQIFQAVPGICSLEPAKKSTLLKQYFSVLLMTLVDPLPILFFMILLAGSGEHQTQPLCPMQMSLGVFLGAMLWWTILSSVCHVCRSRFNALKMRWLNRVSGGAIASFGMVMMGRAIVTFP
jgi:threonine/homoserine/homoserine lactone efflux protein